MTSTMTTSAASNMFTREYARIALMSWIVLNGAHISKTCVNPRQTTTMPVVGDSIESVLTRPINEVAESTRR